MNNDYTLIPFGHNCTPAFQFYELGLRAQSLPFDWLFIPSYTMMDYARDLIETDFEYFLADLQYDSSGKVVAGKYPEVQFFHHDLIKNQTVGLEDEQDDHIQAFQRRAKRFLRLIATKKVFFTSFIRNRDLQVEERARFFWDSLDRLSEVLEQRNVVYQQLIVIYDRDTFDIGGCQVPENLPEHIHVREFVLEHELNPYMGRVKTFAQILGEFCPLDPDMIERVDQKQEEMRLHIPRW